MRALVLLGVLVAAYFQSGPLFFVLLVILLLNTAARLWLREISSGLRVARSLERRLFFGEQTTVTLELANTSGFSIPWIVAAESLPVALRLAERCSQVVSLQAGQCGVISYILVGRQRGLHSIGPLTLSVGDIFGLARRELYMREPEYLLVYPRILAVQELELPSRALFGDVRVRRPLLGDPARVGGIRDYRPGDPLHDIHWRATAAAGSLQVKQYDAATTIQTTIYLDLERSSYRSGNMFEATELAISVAATIAQRLIHLRQEVGLTTNGWLRPLADAASALTRDMPDTILLAAADGPASHGPAGAAEPASVPPPIAASKGQAQLMRILEQLARLESVDGDTGLRDLHWHALGLPWGATAVIITGFVNHDLLAALHRLRQTGLLVVLLVASRQTIDGGTEAQARAVGVRLHRVWSDLPTLAVPA